MSVLGQIIQTGDWKGEKHVPVIHVPEKVTAGELAEIKVCIGEEIAHPNTLEHHISWIKLLYLPEGAKLPVEIYHVNFSSNGENEMFTEPYAVARVKLPKSGKVIALSYCNIHGLWENSADITVG